ncbi:MAG: TonB-dependent receptor [Calditrichaeota bacterium]|nr:MAG: TonB-dependent receptor [Calditrichota bacterium]
MKRATSPIVFFLIVLWSMSLWAGTTGKIAGRIVDEETGEPLIGANVMVDGQPLGAATDVDGYYFIINVPPGVYSLTVSYVGYNDVHIKNVLVQTDLTTTQNIRMKSETLTTEAVVVVAKKPVIEKDVAASQKTISAAEVKALPVSNVGQLIGLQAGVTSDYQIRGSSSSEALFVLDGIPLRDTRNNEPISEIPLSAIQEVNVQSGGFGAEYDNVRSGVVNVVSRLGNKDRYDVNIIAKYRPPMPKHFGISPYNPDAYWLRPYTDDAVAWVGTENGSWDKYTKRQYPNFSGWESISQRTLQDDDPTNDLSPEQAQRLFLWQYRKKGEINAPDYDIDGTISGPLPFFSKDLGNMRFSASYKRSRSMYMVALTTPDLVTDSYLLRLTSDLSPNMKLSLMGLWSTTTGTARSRSGGTSLFTSTTNVASAVNSAGFTTPWRLFTDVYFSASERTAQILSAKLTNVVSPSTFWEAKLIATTRHYETGPIRFRNSTKKYELWDGYFVDEAPVGYYPDAQFSVDGSLGMGGAVSVGRDTSTITNWQASFDITSQVNRNNEVKAGAKLIFENYDLGFGQVNHFLPEGNTWTSIKEKPLRGVVYLQDKMEFDGLIANLGLIMDYYSLNGNWFQADPFSREFYSSNYDPATEKEFRNREVAPRVTFSPRISISHPISANSKLFFNYGHYRQMPTSERFYRVQRDLRNQLDAIGDPTIPLAANISYELGFDQSLFDTYLLRISAYYKDVKDEEFWVRYISSDSKVNYIKITSNGYSDTRGLEFDLTKRSGDWVTGNINFEYRVRTSGYFDFARQYENPADQLQYEQKNPTQIKPRPQPRLKSYIDLHTPMAFGPKIMDQHLLEDWHLNFISSWTGGRWFTWNPNAVPGISYNVQYKDYYNVDLRLAKTFTFGNVDVNFYADIFNLFNFKHFSGVSFSDIFDYDYYMRSLHLPESVTNKLGYGAIPGDDQPGDYRPDGVAYQPMEWVADIANLSSPDENVIYYDAASRGYYELGSGGEMQKVAQSRLDKVLEDKAYIDMPNQTYFTFLNPRNIFFGFTLKFHL